MTPFQKNQSITSLVYTRKNTMSKKAERRLAKKLEKEKKQKNSTSVFLPDLQPSADNDDYVVFSLKSLHKDYNLSSSLCDSQIKCDLLQKMYTMCCTTWNTLFTKRKNCGGLEPLDVEIFKVSMPSCVTDDIDHLYAMRFNGQNSRLIGYRSQNIFHAIFIDVDLSTYKHGD